MSGQNSGGTAGTTGTTGSTGSTGTDSLGSTVKRRSSQVTKGVAIGIGVVLLLVGIGGGYFLGAYITKTSATTVDITEAGSTLLEPLMDIWGPNYTSSLSSSHVVLSPSGGGSGDGQSYSEAGTVDIGASDAYTANNLGVVDVPVAISSQLIVYNLGTSFQHVHLNLNGTILAEIYEGTITNWDNALIKGANPGVTLPDQAITPIYRSDSSGDTYIFTTYCDMSYPSWTYGNSTKAFIPPTGTNPPGGEPGDGNIGVVDQLNNYTGAIGYVGISYMSYVLANDKFGYAALGDNKANSAVGGTVGSNYVNWSTTNVSYDTSLGLNELDYAADGLAVSLILGGSPAGPTTWSVGGGGTNPSTADPTPYPITNLEYTLIKTHPASPSHQAYVVAFVLWAVTYGNNVTRYLSQVGFNPLTPQLLGLDLEALATVQIAT